MSIQVEDEISALSRELNALKSVNETIKASYKDFQGSYSHKTAVPKHAANLWHNINSSLQDCRRLIEDLEQLVEAIIGKEKSDSGFRLASNLETFRKQLRKQSREADFDKLYGRLNTFQNTLQLMLDLVILTDARQSHSVVAESLDEFKRITGKSLCEIKDSLSSVLSSVSVQDATILHESLSSAETTVSLASANEHFSLPQGNEKFYTGRQNLLTKVKDAFTKPSSPGQSQFQKRIINGSRVAYIYRINYAEPRSYWGIFWINASSNELARKTYQDIAKVGGVDRNDRAAKYWLSNLKTQWLLIIDNVDDPEVRLDDYIPDGERGHVLITTRIPSNKVYGTVGPQHLHFGGLEDEDGNIRLLKAASKPVDRDLRGQGFATSITKSLGALPLALLHAGKAIMKKLCTLENYLQYHQIEKQKVREARNLRGFQKGDNIYMNIYSSLEINFRGLQNKGTREAQDAIELLQILSFFHHENIRLDFLTKIATNATIELEEQKKEHAGQKMMTATTRVKIWKNTCKAVMLMLADLIYKERTPPVLPQLFRDGSEFERFGEFRLLAALNGLTQLSLMTFNEVNDSCSMHPVVHTWARERPEFSATEQAVWCQAATTALAQCILLPPLGNGEADEILRSQLYPHIDHVRDRQREIDERIMESQKSRRTTLLLSRPNMSRTQITQLAKFSRVYSQSGRWVKAQELQLTVKDFCSDMLGEEHPSTLKIKLALAGTKWHLSRGNEAAELHDQVLRVYSRSLGEDHPHTLKVMDVLGESRRQQGRYTDSEKLHERALMGMSEVLGRDHEDTLKAMDNLGRVYGSQWRTEKAKELHSEAVAGMRKNEKLGPTHSETLIAMDNLAMTYMGLRRDAHSSEVNEAYQLLLEVVKAREARLGKEHPHTLWAIGNLARVKSAQGNLTEAEIDLRNGISVAERNMGATHFGTLFGKMHLGDVLIKQQRLADAERLLHEVADGHSNRIVASKGEQPDRVKVFELLSRCFQLQGRLDEAIDACNFAIERLNTLGGHAHPYMKVLKDKYTILQELRKTYLIPDCGSD